MLFKLIVKLCIIFFIYSEMLYASNDTLIGTYILQGHIQKPLLVTRDSQSNWGFVNAYLDTQDEGYLYKLYCGNNHCIATAAVESTPLSWPHNTRTPLFLFKEFDKWEKITSITNLPEMDDGITTSISCEDNNCVAAGFYQTKQGPTYLLLLLSVDYGKTWSRSTTIKDLPGGQNFLSSVDCQSQYCIAAGRIYKKSPANNDLLVIKRDVNHEVWRTIKNIPKLPLKGWSTISHVKCQENNCIIIGSYSLYDDNDGTFTHYPIILTSQDKGESWEVAKTPSELENENLLLLSDMTFTNNSIIIVGRADHAVLILVSKDKGLTWDTIKKFAGSTAKPGALSAISCTQKYCIAAGDWYRDKDKYRLSILSSQDNGQTWSVQPNISGVRYVSSLTAVHCEDNHCIIAGNYSDPLDDSYPLLLESADFGRTWAIQNISHFPYQAYQVNISDVK